MKTELRFDQENFYLCMNCYKIYDENPWECRDSKGKTHAKFVDMAKFLGGHPKVRSFTTSESILRFDIGQIKGLEFVTSLGNINLQRILNEKGFKTIAEISNLEAKNEGDRSPKKVKEKALNLVLDLNKQGEKYFVFSNSYLGSCISYTFMKKGQE